MRMCAKRQRSALVKCLLFASLDSLCTLLVLVIGDGTQKVPGLMVKQQAFIFTKKIKFKIKILVYLMPCENPYPAHTRYLVGLTCDTKRSSGCFRMHNSTSKDSIILN